MTTTINASPSNGLVQTADGSGILKVQSNGVTTNALAWIRFTGAATPTIASSYNVTSLTRNSTGSYTINFTTPTTDANYAAIGLTQWTGGPYIMGFSSQSTSGVSVVTGTPAGTSTDLPANVAIFGN